MDAQQLSDLYELQLLKARYFRFMDTRQWDRFRDLFTDDMQLYIEDAAVPQADATPAFADPEALLAHLSGSDPGKITIHQGHMPEIELVDADTATGIWAMFDWVDDPVMGAWQGYGHYHERYRRCPDGKWRISEVRLTRLRNNSVEPKGSERNPRPGRRPTAPTD